MSLDTFDCILAALSKLNEQSLCLRTQVIKIGTRYEFFRHSILHNCLDPLQTKKNERTRGVLHFLARLNPSRGSGGEPFHLAIVYPLQARFAINRSSVEIITAGSHGSDKSISSLIACSTRFAARRSRRVFDRNLGVLEFLGRLHC